MPGERDIREVSDQLVGRFARDAEIIPQNFETIEKMELFLKSKISGKI